MQKEQVNNLLKKYLNPVYSFVFRLVQDKDLAEDITQETFIKAWKKIDTDQNIKSFLFTIARNLAFDHFRKKKDEMLEEIEVIDSEPLPPELYERKEIEDVFKKIKHQHLEIVMLHDIEEMTFEEISKIVTRPMNTVKSQYRRALLDIREFLHQNYPDIRI